MGFRDFLILLIKRHKNNYKISIGKFYELFLGGISDVPYRGYGSPVTGVALDYEQQKTIEYRIGAREC